MATAPESAARLAVAAAFRKYEAALHRYVLRRLRRPQDARDLTQDIFERFMKVDRSAAIRNPQAYLFGIASNVISEARIAQERNMVTYDSDTVDRRAQDLDHGAPDELAERAGLQRDIVSALSRLPDSHLAAVMLVKGEGLSYEEAARVSGMTASTIGTYLTHARARLKSMLEEYYNPGDAPR
jgi:RNA polymerase sigma-70 factor (ECF subfamily)